MSGPRVVSLVPSVTETLLAWGITPIGVTRFCEQPHLRAVGGTKDPDLAAIGALAPDLVVVCEEENRREDAEALVAAGCPLEVLRIDAVADVPRELARLAERIGLDPATVPTGALPSEQIEAGANVPAPKRRRAFVPIWRNPWMTIGACYGTDVLARSGIDNPWVDAVERYPVTSLEEASTREVELVIAPSEPYRFGTRHIPELAEVAPVVLVDGQDLFWWGVRTPAALGRLRAELLEAPGT